MRVHTPVLLERVLEILAVRDGGHYIDGTLGGGGHSEAILARGGRVLGLDRDSEILALTRERLAGFGERLVCEHANFADAATVHAALGWPPVDGLLLDLGVSSYQLDTPRRGFSFQADGPLDMRMDPGSETTALELLQQLDEKALADVIYQNGEEVKSRAIAKALVQARRHGGLNTTRKVAMVIEGAVGRRGRIHPATRTFQALRIAVNDELGAVSQVLDRIGPIISSGGRLLVIAFHSLEDRIVKQRFKEWKRAKTWRILTKKPLIASLEEVAANPRARSAKLRVAEKR